MPNERLDKALKRVAELELENSRLRRLVIEISLQKIALEETINASMN